VELKYIAVTNSLLLTLALAALAVIMWRLRDSLQSERAAVLAGLGAIMYLILTVVTAGTPE